MATKKVNLCGYVSYLSLCIKQMPIQSGDVAITYADITKSKRLLGYDPKTSIDEGIRNFVEWYKTQPYS